MSHEVSHAVIDQVVRDAVALLVRLRADHLPVEAAWDEIVRLRERHPDRFLHLVWEQESYLRKIHYDILIGVDAGTLSVSYCADDEVPWPSRGLQRIKEAVVVRVNDQPVEIGQVVTSLDYAWHQLHVGRHLVEMSLVAQAIRARKIKVSDEQLAADLTEFRVRRRLFTATAVERWLAEHGTSELQLEDHLRQDAARDELRRQISGDGDAQAAYFAAHRSDFDRIQVARIFVTERESADSLFRELCSEPQRFLAVAQRQFLRDAGRAELFMTLRRDELAPGEAALVFETEPGQLAPVLASGDGFEVVQVLRRIPAVLDDETRALIGERVFERWLGEQRARARVEWFWGAAEASEVPAMSL